MTPFGLLALGPAWAITLAVGFIAARLSSRTGPGLLLLCLAQGAWLTGLLLLDSGAVSWAERLLPSGMLLAGAFVQAASDVGGATARRAVRLAWTGSVGVSVLGLVAPRTLYGPGARGIGPLFLPLAIVSTLGALLVLRHMLQLVRTAPDGLQRRRRLGLLLANGCGALGGGGAISLHITGLAPVGVAAPFLLVSVLLAADAVWRTEVGRGRQLLLQGFAQAVLTAAVSSVVLVVFVWGFPNVVPGGATLSVWGLLVAFLVTLPLDPLRQLVVERMSGTLFEKPLAVRSLAEEADTQAARADHAEALAQVGRLASGVAHEVRNPLGVILAEAKLLERTGADPESVATIRAQVQRASAFVDDLLYYAKPRALAFADVEVVEAVEEGIRFATRALAGSESRIVTLTTGAHYIQADRSALVEVARNLVTNALIATEAKPGAAVRVGVHVVDGGAEVVVEDDGPGVPETLENRLFEAFATGRGRDAKHPGTGLGLALCARHVHAHGGTIRHERPATGGARFVVRFPDTPSRGS